ncbi:MAG TPA: hypothetical protein QF433_01700, partial [Candidatus Thalassarchaeaceae archaeon]|nr:hypothetical protein [Candidatus Thalassarchaeaceae archaeon]
MSLSGCVGSEIPSKLMLKLSAQAVLILLSRSELVTSLDAIQISKKMWSNQNIKVGKAIFDDE